jgi:hypothetical protein
MRNIKHEFIEKYILPLLEPIVIFFAKYGVVRVTVIAVPTLIILLLAIKSEIKNESKSLLIAYIFAVIVILLAILKFQFLTTQE